MGMGFNLAEIGARVRAYRLGAGYNADQLASRLGVSRAALYRIEQGNIVKVDVLESIAAILGTSLASLLGVGAEYHANAASYQARMQQLEENASHIVALFSPLSYLLTTEFYDHDLAVMLREAAPETLGGAERQRGIRALLRTLGERRRQMNDRRPSITCLISLEELRQLVALGLVGCRGLPDEVIGQRRAAACREVRHLSAMMKVEPVGVQIGLIEDVVPNVAFQLFYKGNEVLLGVSPFRIAALPNLDVGVASITSNPEAVNMHVQLFDRLWGLCRRGSDGARLLDEMLAQAA